MEPSLVRFEHAFGPVPASVREVATALETRWVAAPMLDAAWWEGTPVCDWPAFGAEVRRRLQDAPLQPPQLKRACSASGHGTIIYLPQVLKWGS